MAHGGARSANNHLTDTVRERDGTTKSNADAPGHRSIFDDRQRPRVAQSSGMRKTGE